MEDDALKRMLGGQEAGAGSTLQTKELVELLGQALDEAERALALAEEESMADFVEQGLQQLGELLDEVGSRLPSTEEERADVARGALAAQASHALRVLPQAADDERRRRAANEHGASDGRHGDVGLDLVAEDGGEALGYPRAGEPALQAATLTEREVIEGMVVVEVMLQEAKSALAEVTRDEIEELVAVALACAQIFVIAAKAAQSSLAASVGLAQPHSADLRIEELQSDARGSAAAARGAIDFHRSFVPKILDGRKTATTRWTVAEPHLSAIEPGATLDATSDGVTFAQLRVTTCDRTAFAALDDALAAHEDMPSADGLRKALLGFYPGLKGGAADDATMLVVHFALVGAADADAADADAAGADADAADADASAAGAGAAEGEVRASSSDGGLYDKWRDATPRAPPRSASAGQVGVAARRRLLWRPLRPRVAVAVGGFCRRARERPVASAAAVLAVSPLAWTLLALPPVLVFDSVVQRLYDAHGSGLEATVHGVAQLLRLWWVLGRITGRHAWRAARRRLRRAGGIAGVARGVADAAWWALWNPIRSARLTWDAARGTAIAMYDGLSLANEMVAGARTAQA